MRSDRLRRLAAALLILGWLGRAAANDLVVGQAAPPLVLHDLDGKSIATSDLLGQVVIVTFWATWCVPCRAELPLLSDYARRHGGQGLKILGFTLDGPAHLAELRRIGAGLDFPVGMLGSNWAGGYGRVWRLPVSFVIDRKGILRYDGWQAEQEPWTEAKLDQIVGPLF